MDKTQNRRRVRGLEARKRPGTPNLNRPTLRVGSAYHLHHTYSGQKLASDFLTASEDDTDLDLESTNNFVTAPEFRNASSESYCSESSGTDVDVIQVATELRMGTRASDTEPNPIVLKDYQKCSVTSQGTNTPTTIVGHPPLEAIHGGFDLPRSLTNPNVEKNNEESELDSNFEESDPRHNRLRVSKSIHFDKSSGRREAFGAVIRIENVSDYNMSYCVKTSSPDLLIIHPQVGMIQPKSMTEVMVKTNPKFDFHFADIASEVFQVLATPVFTRGQLEQGKLEILWRAYGTKFFPRVATESHMIDAVYSVHSETLMQDMIRHVCSYWGNDKRVVVNDNPVTEKEYYNAWPLEDDHYAFLSCRKQITSWVSLYRKTRDETRRMRMEMRQCFASIILALSVFLILFALQYENDKKISLGQILFNDMKQFLFRIFSPVPAEPRLEPEKPTGIGRTTILMINRIIKYWT